MQYGAGYVRARVSFSGRRGENEEYKYKYILPTNIRDKYKRDEWEFVV